MPSPFPGMNPYLEQPDLWAGVHHWLINAIARSLGKQLRPKYFVAVEERAYLDVEDSTTLVGIPDDLIVQVSGKVSTPSAIAVAPPPVQPIKVTLPIPETYTEGYLEIRQVGTGHVVTVIEVLSPKNKRTGEGRKQYEEKRNTVLDSSTHLVEIDLLRKGQPMPFSAPNFIKSHYRILVSRSDRRPQADLYAFNLPDAIPAFPIPLQADDAEPLLDLQALLQEVYDQAGYDLRLDYQSQPELGLNEGDRLWVQDWLAQAELRP
jgi:Protein of unknown function (DUF4058)